MVCGRWRARMFDCEIEISGEAGCYRVAARSAAGETGAVPVVFPFDDQALGRQQQALELALLRSVAPLRRLTSVDERLAREFGQRLFEFAFPSEVRTHLSLGRQRAAQERTQVRVRLRVGPPELAVLPWEFLYDPGRDDYVCLSTPLVRYLDVMEPRHLLTVVPPLRILGMVAHPHDLDSLNVEHEQRRLRQALAKLEGSGRVRLSWAEGQTWRDLREALDQNQCHVLHFIGHGGFDRERGEGLLALASEDGGTHRLGAGDLALLLAEHHSLRLVVLNSCDSARGSAAEVFSSTAAVLMRRGIPAVVAMQYEISDEAAITFARDFYTAIAAQHPVEQAVTRARLAIKLTRRDTLEWATPVLYLRSPTGALFDLTNTPPTPHAPLPDPPTLPPLKPNHPETTQPEPPHQPDAPAQEPDEEPDAAFTLGTLLAEQGDVTGAQAAFQRAIDSNHTQWAPKAVYALASLLMEQEDLAGARAAIQRAIDSGQTEAAPMAACALGDLLKEQGDVVGARAAYQRAIDSGHADWAPIAARTLGDLLKEQGDVAGAQAAYQRVIDSGDATWAPKAAIDLGGLLKEQGDVVGARAAYQRAIDSGDATWAPSAAYHLGDLLKEQGDVAGAQVAYQRAIDSGHTTWWATIAACHLGDLLKEQGDVAGARAAYQRAIDSGHANWAPNAAYRLGDLLKEQGDVAGARVAYQRAIDSGDATWAPIAARSLRRLRWWKGWFG